TAEWVKNQNICTRNYIDKIPYRNTIRKKIESLNDYPKYSSPIKAGDNYIFYKNNGLQNQSVIYIQQNLYGEPKILIDPNTYSKEGTTAIGLAGISNDNLFAAFTVQKAGSDWQEIIVYNLTTNKQTSDKLEWVKFSGASWYKDGFFYSRYDAPKAGHEFSSQNQNHKIYYHTLGNTQDKDQLIYTDPANPLRYFGAEVTEDEKHMFISISEGTYGTELLYKNLGREEKEFRVLFKGFDHEYGVIDNISNKLLVISNEGTPNKQLVLVDPNNPQKENWKIIVPEQKELLQSASYVGGKIIVTYLKNCVTKVYQYTPAGVMEKEITLPGNGSASGFGGHRNDDFVFYTFTSFNYPPVIFKYDITTGKSANFRELSLQFDPEDYIVDQVFYPSKDGTKIPMFIVYKKGMKLEGKNPTLLYAYGGFNISLTPSFSASRIAFLNMGGIYVMANLRGGGEYGEEWHKAGMLDKKQNVFDDFFAAAEYLIKNKYTSSPYLAIQGGSNGGLLVGACMTQRPDLYKVAFPAVGVLDMLRYHKFTVGWGWAVEYGSSDKKEQFDVLYKYSPLHNLKNNTEYPATLVTTGDHDDRVVPAHSFKYIAALQEAQKSKSKNPVMIRIETNAGHGAGKPISKQLDEIADIYAFMFWNMAIKTITLN
ncbi:MAG: prolyl oligopeptidase family serine peptidase, partial [Bacteroidota bacterium]|nr:prolyl oligopeptidase family serine peptidase [Bacteroidota bacterium]